MKKLLSLLVVVVIISVLGIGWSLSVSNQSKEVPLEKVTINLKWVHQAQFAGNYVAKEKGFYKNEGLDVTLEPFSYEESTIDSVLSGEADFGIAGAEELLVARQLGKPVKAIGVIYKVNPVALYTLKSSGITKPQDLIGKIVGIEKGINVEYLYEAMMSKLNIDRSKITEIPVGYDASELLTGKVDVSSGYIINEPQLAVEAGHEITTILMGDYGVNMYADVIFTSDEMIEKNPDLVTGVLRATLTGWQYAIENQNEAVDITLKYATSTTKIHQLNMLNSSVPLINTGKGDLGWMDRVSWDRAQGIMFEHGIMTEKINVDDVFTLKFLEEIYKDETP